MSERKSLTQRLQKQSSNTLLALLDDMFASCDDLYFDLASRANSNVEQNLFFESMREVRVTAKQTRDDYQLGLAYLFEQLVKGKGDKSQHENGQADKEKELNLVGDEEVEKGVALSAMQSRARANTKGIFYELSCRMSEAYGIDPIDENNNPLDPAALCELFANSTLVMNIDMKARIILFKQYERYVINRLPEIYTKANALLKDAGIPFTPQKKIKRPTSRRRPGGQASGNENQGEQAYDNYDDQLFATTGGAIYPGGAPYQYGAPSIGDLNNLIASIRTSVPGGLGEQVPWFISGSGAPIQRDELLQLLDAPVPPTHSSSFNIRNYLQHLLSRGQPEGEMRAVQQLDEDVINLVAMFFDFVLDDENIPAKIKALVSRLQMPILKIALRDKAFFSDTKHPARELVNEIAQIGIGIDDEDKSRELIEKIDTLVHEIQDHTGDQKEIFASSLKELKRFGGELEKRAKLVEKRTKETEEGKAKTQIARAKSQHAIQEAMDGKSLPASLSSFIVKFWQEALFTTYLRDGNESPAWLEQLQTMQDLIWSSQPHKDEKSRQRFQRIKDDLYQKIQHGLANSSLTEDEVQAQVEQIRSLHETLAGDAADEIKVETFSAEQEDNLKEAKAEKTWKEMTALERQKVQYQALTYEYIERAEATPIGSWLEFKDKNTGTMVRCKLAAKLEESDTYIFVNRLGFKVIEKARKEFAFDLQRKRARPLKTGPLFDRSLHDVVRRLKKLS